MNEKIAKQTMLVSMVDLHNVKILEIVVNADGRIWVNVDGVCRFRAKKADVTKIEDNRENK